MFLYEVYYSIFFNREREGLCLEALHTHTHTLSHTYTLTRAHTHTHTHTHKHQVLSTLPGCCRYMEKKHAGVIPHL